MVKVSGSSMATPFAPPRPGSTPITTPSTTPMSMSMTLYGESATAKPCISEVISSTRRSSVQTEQGLKRALR